MRKAGPADASQPYEQDDPAAMSAAAAAAQKDNLRCSEKPQFEFITVNRPATSRQDKQVSRAIRAQAMRDYMWKKERQNAANNNNNNNNNNTPDQTARTKNEGPSHFKGRFRLDKSSPVPISTPTSSASSSTSITKYPGQSPPKGFRPAELPAQTSPLSLLRGMCDPFEAYGLSLGPDSRRLVDYYHHGCPMNFVAHNIGGVQCLVNARQDLALFHSILYVVAFMNQVSSDSPGYLYHSTEAFRAINRNLENGLYTDTTIAAVALIATTEILAGNFEQAKIHMDGLESMVMKRGGIGNIKDRHGRAVQWSDFCYSSTWDCRPRFVRNLDRQEQESVEAVTDTTHLLSDPSAVFGIDTPLFSVILSLRRITTVMNETQNFDMSKLKASQEIYDIEYQLHLLKLDTEPYPATPVISMSIAAHIYLYLVIREIPHGVGLIDALVSRLRTSLETQGQSWQERGYEAQYWLLWVLFVGFGATTRQADEEWFLGGIRSQMAMISNSQAMAVEPENALRRVLWHNVWCGKQYFRLRARLSM